MQKSKLQFKNKILPQWVFWLFVVFLIMFISYIGIITEIHPLSFLNSNAGAVQGISTIILVIVTGFYAWQTHKTNSLISMQIFPNIFITPDKLYSQFIDAEDIKKIKNEIMKYAGFQDAIRFILKYSVSNHSASSGSVEKPRLLIKNPLNGNKKCLSSNLRDVVIDPEGEIKNTLYLMAGQTKNIENEFYWRFNGDGQDYLDFFDNASLLEYKILYKNVVGKETEVSLIKDKILSTQKYYEQRD